MYQKKENISKNLDKGTTKNVVRSYKPSAKSTLDIIKKVNNNDFVEDDNLFMTTLYLSEQDSRISIENERFFISKNNVILFSVPTIKIQQIVIFGNIIVSYQVTSYCLINNPSC